MKDENDYLLIKSQIIIYDTIYPCVNIMKMFITLYRRQNIPQCAGLIVTQH